MVNASRIIWEFLVVRINYVLKIRLITYRKPSIVNYLVATTSYTWHKKILHKTTDKNLKILSNNKYIENFNNSMSAIKKSKSEFTLASFSQKRSLVVVQGLGFVGTAMLAALAQARDKSGEPYFNVAGIDLKNKNGLEKIKTILAGKSPIVSEDNTIETSIKDGIEKGNLTATSCSGVYEYADVVVVDIHLDVLKVAAGITENYEFSYDNYIDALKTVANKIKEDTLVIIETTVPPGTTEKIIRPIFEQIFMERGLKPENIHLSHSYERVMPGKGYLKSITEFYRVYSGINRKSRNKAKNFFSKFINTESYPLHELHNTTSSELSKVLENSYRAMNIAFIQEWTEFAEKAGVNLYEVIGAIRKRPTHKNIMNPGFGVGGYCLTKDALLADYGFKHNFGGNGLKYSLEAIKTNDLMPLHTCELLEKKLPNLNLKKIAILGLSYIKDVADTRYTPTHTLYKFLKTRTNNIFIHDPLISYWEEENISISTNITDLNDFKPNCIIICVGHTQYTEIELQDILQLTDDLECVIDTCDVLNDSFNSELSKKNIKTIGIGKGHWK